MKIDVGSVKVSNRIRKDIGDVAELAMDIEERWLFSLLRLHDLLTYRIIPGMKNRAKHNMGITYIRRTTMVKAYRSNKRGDA